MKPIQVMMDEDLLSELDQAEEVRREGRSAVIRRALEQYLRRRRNLLIRERYQRAYGADPGLGPEYSGWEEEGVWPEE
jgi:metal-responsive CopG/Arc/MetJ family transcriptional regulator